ncbi:MAG TPA: PEP-utilizing enzyme [Candidatus Dormibacteraeota bacterium]|jgi:phosphohistidine swiveling domain-containing protein
MTATSTVIGTGTPTFAAGRVEGETVHITSPVEVLDLLEDPDRVAGLVLVIDEPGATFLSPLLLAGPRAVVCTAGTPKSHLGIVTREFDIPCVMGVQLSAALPDGTHVEIRFDDAGHASLLAAGGEGA